MMQARLGFNNIFHKMHNGARCQHHANNITRPSLGRRHLARRPSSPSPSHSAATAEAGTTTSTSSGICTACPKQPSRLVPRSTGQTAGCTPAAPMPLPLPSTTACRTWTLHSETAWGRPAGTQRAASRWFPCCGKGVEKHRTCKDTHHPTHSEILMTKRKMRMSASATITRPLKSLSL